MQVLEKSFPHGANAISFSRVYSTDTLPSRIKAVMPYDEFPIVQGEDITTYQRACPNDMVATGIQLNEEQRTTLLTCSPVQHKSQLDNSDCVRVRAPYKINQRSDWIVRFPYEAMGKCPPCYMLTGVDYNFDKPYIDIQCCARKDITPPAPTKTHTLMMVVVYGTILSVLLCILIVLTRPRRPRYKRV